jgi:hypothetical protein
MTPNEAVEKYHFRALGLRYILNSRALVISPPGSASPEGELLRTTALAQGRTLTGIRRWAVELQARPNHNKATCALANKLARICYAVLRDQTPFGQPVTRLGKKIQRQAFSIAHSPDYSHSPSLASRRLAHHGNPGRTTTQQSR